MVGVLERCSHGFSGGPERSLSRTPRCGRPQDVDCIYRRDIREPWKVTSYLDHIGGILRKTRQETGMTQAEQARLAGMSQPNISAVESGSRGVTPTLASTLLTVSRTRPGIVLEFVSDEIKRAGDEHRISNIRVFGSVSKGVDDFRSDLDLLVDYTPESVGFPFFAFMEDVKDIMGPIRVDIVANEPGNSFVAAIEPTARPIWRATTKDVSRRSPIVTLNHERHLNTADSSTRQIR